MSIIIDYSDIDITDKTILQEQFNYYRKGWNDSVHQLDQIGKEVIELTRKLAKRKNDVRKENPSAKSLTAILEEDEEYMELKYRLEAYKLSEKIIQENIDMVKTDVNILRGTLYSKF